MRPCEGPMRPCEGTGKMTEPGHRIPRPGLSGSLVAALALMACAQFEPVYAPGEALEKIDQGQSALARGHPSEARALFGEALAAAQERDAPQLENDARIGIAESERELGDLGAALTQLEAARKSVQGPDPDPAQLAVIEIALGGTALAAGQPEKARAWLDAGIRHAGETHQTRLRAAGQLDLGTLLALQGESQQALDVYRASAESALAAGEALAAAKALANAARLELSDPALSASLLLRSAEFAQSLPPSHAKANLLISLGERQMSLSEALPQNPGAEEANAADLLLAALAAAETVNDPRAASYALGFLGAFYEKTGRPDQALATTDEAVARAARIDAPESLYRWQAQRGRLLAAAGRGPEAITAYQFAVDRLQSLRHREAWGGGLRPSTFQSDAAPIYSALVDLLLRQAQAQADSSQKPVGAMDGAEQALLRRARDTVEQLRAAELRDYYRDDCVDALQAKLTGLESVSGSALVLYPIPLSDRLVVLVGMPSGRLEQFRGTRGPRRSRERGPSVAKATRQPSHSPLPRPRPHPLRLADPPHGRTARYGRHRHPRLCAQRRAPVHPDGDAPQRRSVSHRTVRLGADPGTQPHRPPSHGLRKRSRFGGRGKPRHRRLLTASLCDRRSSGDQ